MGVYNIKIINEIESSEMIFLKRTTGFTKRNRLRNENRNEGEVLSIIQKHRMEWSQHQDRVDERRLPKVAYRYIDPLQQGI